MAEMDPEMMESGTGSEMESEMDDLMGMEGSTPFWSLTVPAGKEVELEEPKFDAIIRVTSATFGKEVKKHSRSVVMCKSMDMPGAVPVLVLREGTCETLSVDLRFDGPASFSIAGTATSTVTLCGFLEPRRLKGMGMGEDDEELMEQKQMEGLEGDEELQPADKQENGLEEEEEEDNEGEDQDEDEDEEAPPQPKKARKAAAGAEPAMKKAKTGSKAMLRLGNTGLTYRDIKKGSGPPLRALHKATVKYVGQLEDSSVFDKCLTPDGFTFTLGKNEVIKGWDLGLKGVKVGTKRKLVVPARLAYGAKGMPPKIPPNETLTFTIEVTGAN